jgi:hypothetical protein
VVCSHCNDGRSERRFLRTASRPRACGPSRAFGGVPRERRQVLLHAGRPTSRQIPPPRTSTLHGPERSGVSPRCCSSSQTFTRSLQVGLGRTTRAQRARPALASLSHCSDPALSVGPTTSEVVFAHKARAAIPVCRPSKGTPRETSSTPVREGASTLATLGRPGPNASSWRR